MSSELAHQKTALVTGAAARIGADISRTLHRRGCHVILHYNSSVDAAEQLAAELNAERPDSVTLASCDLSLARGVEELAATVKSVSRELTVLVNNASRFYPTRVADTRAFQWDDLVDSNLRAPYFLVQALLPELESASGSVVNIIDIHGEKPMKGHAVYSITKAGLAMMTRALARELAPKIRVNGVSPGAILWPEQPMPDEVREEILGHIAMGRTGTPSDISEAVAFLGLEAPYITGQILAVDGGRSLNM
jgi:pteridine reductase